MVKNFKTESLVRTKNIINFSLIMASIFSTPSLLAHNYKGLKYGTKNDPFWLEIKGALKLDQRFFLGKKDALKNGALLRELSLNFDGGLSKDLSLTIGLGFDAKNSAVRVEDAYITYSGFKQFGENFRISLGKVNPSFCLENHSSGKWIPFLERSSVTTAFRPNPGLGISINKWQNDYSLNASITQPSPSEDKVNASGNKIDKSDRFQYNFRATKVHMFAPNKLIQAGIFGNYKHDSSTGITFTTAPEVKTRYSNADASLLNTDNGNTKILSKQHYTIGAEILSQNGPLSFEAEYQLTKVNRDKSQSPYNLRFRGYRSNVNYVLTGESRNFRHSDGTLGEVIPASDSGAWEISGRYDYINLNNKDIIGGSAHHTGVGATWYINRNFSTTFECIRSTVYKKITLEKLKFNSIAARLQLVF